MAKSGYNKEANKIRRELNRRRRHLVKQIINSASTEAVENTPVFKNTTGWLTW